MVLVYSTTVFLNAALLFIIEPMVAKMILPFLGGKPGGLEHKSDVLPGVPSGGLRLCALRHLLARHATTRIVTPCSGVYRVVASAGCSTGSLVDNADARSGEPGFGGPNGIHRVPIFGLVGRRTFDAKMDCPR